MTDSLFENATWRFVTSGTLITCYAVADLVASRRERRLPGVAVPWRLRLLVAVAMLGYYALIAPTGGALLGGIGNLAGIGVVLGAIVLRSSRVVPHAGVAGKALCCAGLPIATGVLWGIVVLTLPAVVASLYWWRRTEPTATPSSPHTS